MTCVLIRPQVEVTSGENDSSAFEEMHVQVSAETYEKVDAAVALIELLVTPASVSTQYYDVLLGFTVNTNAAIQYLFFFFCVCVS